MVIKHQMKMAEYSDGYKNGIEDGYKKGLSEGFNGGMYNGIMTTVGVGFMGALLGACGFYMIHNR